MWQLGLFLFPETKYFCTGLNKTCLVSVMYKIKQNCISVQMGYTSDRLNSSGAKDS